MDLTDLKRLIAEVSELPGIPERETTIFGIGARGHFENPTTDVLAFFLDSNASHNLSDLALRALFSSLQKYVSEPLDMSLVAPPKREVITDNSNRIDLLLESDNWVLILENKIFHEQINPFYDYEKFAEQKFPNKQLIYVVLSPSGQAPNGWYGVSYLSLIAELQNNLASHFISQPMNKWMFLLREFIVHMEQLMTKGTRVPMETHSYVLNHLADIENAQKLKDAVIKELLNECTALLQEVFQEREIHASLNSWGMSSVLRFKVTGWTGETDVVIFFGGESNNVTHTYIDSLNSDELKLAAQDTIEVSGFTDRWTEKKGTMLVFKKPLQSLDKEVIFKEITERMLRVDLFEKEVRKQL